MRHADGWRDLARPTILAGSLLVAVLAVYVAFEGRTGGGYLQRAAIVLFCAGVVTLALRVRAVLQPEIENRSAGRKCAKDLDRQNDECLLRSPRHPCNRENRHQHHLQDQPKLKDVRLRPLILLANGTREPNSRQHHGEDRERHRNWNPSERALDHLVHLFLAGTREGPWAS
jgi:hypothetical protein